MEAGAGLAATVSSWRTGLEAGAGLAATVSSWRTGLVAGGAWSEDTASFDGASVLPGLASGVDAASMAGDADRRRSNWLASGAFGSNAEPAAVLASDAVGARVAMVSLLPSSAPRSISRTDATAINATIRTTIMTMERRTLPHNILR